VWVWGIGKGGYELISIFLLFCFASSVFGIVTERTPFLKFASSLSSSRSVGKLNDLLKRP
jgi:hypothetical protein